MRLFWTFFISMCLVGALAACGVQSPPEAMPDPEDEVPTAELPAGEEPEVPERPETPPASSPGRDDTVYDCGGVAVALPTKYLDRLIVETEFSDIPRPWKPLISVYERAPAGAAAAFAEDYFGPKPAPEDLQPLDAEEEARVIAGLLRG